MALVYLCDGLKEMEQYQRFEIRRCGIISKIKVLHLKIKVYMKNVAVFTH